MDKGDSKGHNEGLGFEFKYTVINCIKLSEGDGQVECRMYFYRGVVTKSGQSPSPSWSLNVITAVRRFGFSLCAVPLRSFFILMYKGSEINYNKDE